MDHAVVTQPGVGDRSQPFERLVVVGDDRLIGQVAGGAHQHSRGEPVEQEVMHGGIGQHHPHIRGVTGHGDRPRGLQRATAVATQQQNRALWPEQGSNFSGTRYGHAGEHLQTSHHHRQRLATAPLACAQRRDGQRVGGVAHQVIPANALHSNDRTVDEQSLRGAQRALASVQPFAATVDQLQSRPAFVTCHWLRVKAPIGGIVVLARACRAHLEGGHRGACPVVWQTERDREPGTTVRTGDERVAVAPIARIEHLPQAIGAHRQIGWQRSSRSMCRAATGDRAHDAELDVARARAGCCFHGGDVRHRR